MSDLREADKWLENNPICDADDLNKRERELVKAAWQAALSANGGEAVPVAWAVFADNGNIRIWGREKPEAFPEAVPLYLSPTVKDSLTVQSEPIGYADPDSLNDYRAGDRLHIPVYRPDASEEWQSGIPVYLHPAPPSVAVPEGWMLFPVEAWLFLTGEGPLSGLHFGEGVCDDKTGRAKPFWWRSHIRNMLTAAPSPDHIADAGKVSFVDGLGAQRMTAEECKEGIEYIIHGDNIYWPLSDDDELRLIQAACGNGEFTYPQATPSVPENDNGVSSAYDSGYLDAMLYARVCCDRLDNPENTKDYRDCARFLDLIFKSEIDEAARLRAAGDEGEEV